MQNVRRYDILILLKKETGENPVRARRRKARNIRFSIYTPQYKDKPLGNREGEKRWVPQSEYFLSAVPKTRVPKKWDEIKI